MMKEIRPEHEWLQKFVGEWTSASDPVTSGDGPASPFEGTETVRSLGGIWIVAEGTGGMPGDADSRTMTTLGFDASRGRFVGTWIGSMMTYHWVYDGYLEDDQRTLTLESFGPDMQGQGNTTKFRDRMHFVDDDHRVLTAEVQNGDGAWKPLMTVHYRRQLQLPPA